MDETDRPLPFKEAVRFFKSRPHEQTVRRWAKNGVLRAGRRVKLGSLKIGGRVFTNRQFIKEFLHEQPPQDQAPGTPDQASIEARLDDELR